MKILLLGGTGEARALAQALAEAGVDCTVSLVGRTDAPAYAGTTRVGGFGGPEGLAAALAAGGFTHLVDATHPFAAAISPAARRAAGEAGIAYLRLQRPPWRPPPGADVREVPSLEAAAASLAAGSHVFLTVGSGSLAPFLARRDVRFLVRAITPPALGDRDDIEVILARGPFSVAGERALFEARRFDALVTKNAGGGETEAKLVAAAQTATPVVMVARPAGQPPPDADSVAAMMALLLGKR